MPASNIDSVSVSQEGVKITGKVEGVGAGTYHVELLHVWLAQPGIVDSTPPDGAGLAMDCAPSSNTKLFNGDTFEVKADPAGVNNTGVFGTFVAGPATASAIAVLRRKAEGTGAEKEVLQWTQIITVT
jgi:hypothetical protein